MVRCQKTKEKARILPIDLLQCSFTNLNVMPRGVFIWVFAIHAITRLPMKSIVTVLAVVLQASCRYRLNNNSGQAKDWTFSPAQANDVRTLIKFRAGIPGAYTKHQACQSLVAFRPSQSASRSRLKFRIQVDAPCMNRTCLVHAERRRIRCLIGPMADSGVGF